MIPTRSSVGPRLVGDSSTRPPARRARTWSPAYRELGISRVIGMIRGSAESNEALAAWAEDCRAGGASLADSVEIGS